MMAMSPPSYRGEEESPLLIATARTALMYETDFDRDALAPVVVTEKYAVEAKSYQPLSARRVTSTYGTLTLNQIEATQDCFSVKKPSPEHGSPTGSNNQSETESDSDGSCGSSATQPPVIQSILRIRNGELGPRTLEKKSSSVGFAIDIGDTDDEDDEFECDDHARPTRSKRTTARRQSCASRCIPRRLTLEEKAALYRVRPDLQLQPMPVLLRDVEEMRRRRQRKIVFLILGGTLMILMMVVMYYVFTQVK